MRAQDLLKAVEADQQSHISFLQAFAQAPSPNPPGDTVAAADVLIRYLRDQGIEPEIISPQANNPNVVSDFTCAEEGPRLIMNGHIDVFPVGDADQWERDPWSGDIVDGRLHGRGVVDMK